MQELSRRLLWPPPGVHHHRPAGIERDFHRHLWIRERGAKFPRYPHAPLFQLGDGTEDPQPAEIVLNRGEERGNINVHQSPDPP